MPGSQQAHRSGHLEAGHDQRPIAARRQQRLAVPQDRRAADRRVLNRRELLDEQARRSFRRHAESRLARQRANVDRQIGKLADCLARDRDQAIANGADIDADERIASLDAEGHRLPAVGERFPAADPG